MLKVQAGERKTRRYETWLMDLERLGVQFLVLDIQRDEGLVQAARSNPSWIVDFEDGQAVLFARTAA
jgi:hypothetical protein